IVLCWYMIIYTSLKNPIDEMLYSEITRFKIVDLPRYSEVINSDTSYDLRDDGSFVSLHYRLDNINSREYVSIYVDNFRQFVLSYKLFLKNNQILIIENNYEEKNNIKQDVYILTEDRENKIVVSEKFFQILSENNLDPKWLREKSSFVLNEILLKPWFDKGSQRYSFENLGNLKIEESTLLK
ncbi:TipC family immunity protein, partial [Streptococcus acidominimus]